MSQEKQKVLRILRDSGLINLADTVRYPVSVLKYYLKTRLFYARNPGFKVPPRFLAFDAYSAPDWDFYKISGSETATFLSAIAKRYLPENASLRVLEWGCGPARVIRHIPSNFGSGAEAYGSDYNRETIRWCTQNIHGVTFGLNELRPPLPFNDRFFDFIYSISVFTHLSEPVGHEWVNELYRIMRSGAIAVISTNGDRQLDMLLPDEIETYKTRGVVVRGRVQEGKKMFLAFHSPAYTKECLFKSFEVMEFASGAFPYTGQDLWILRKP
jgi:SAM-dependent methyltransferase